MFRRLLVFDYVVKKSMRRLMKFLLSFMMIQLVGKGKIENQINVTRGMSELKQLE